MKHKPVYLTERSKLDREFIYLHMSNHYRRIGNAKKSIDNSPPIGYKGKRPATSQPGVTRNKINKNYDNTLLTDRSLSTNSNRDSSWGTESYTGGSRYHARCIPDLPNTPKCNYDYDLVDRIAYDTKHGPSAYSDKSWSKPKDQSPDKRYSVTATLKDSKPEMKSGASMAPHTMKVAPTVSGNTERTQKRKFSIQKKLKPPEAPVKATKSCPSIRDTFSSKSLKTPAVSKLRSLRVYHPPRRRKSRIKADSQPHSEHNPEECVIRNRASNPEECKCAKICICDGNETILKKISLSAKDQSMTSSRDSAYNGGVSSVPESRTPTPDQKRKKECGCCCCERVKRVGKVREVAKAEQGPAGPCDSRRASNVSQQRMKMRVPEKEYDKIQDDTLYVTFIQEITTEILEKNLYTNKALKKVMKKHLLKNLKRLNKDRMLQELDYLRIQLGIPEDKTLFDLNIENSDSIIEVAEVYPVISDSAFVMPAVSAKSHPQTKPSPKMKFHSNTENTSGTDDGDNTSATRVTNEIQEPAEKTTCVSHNRDISSDDSDRPKKRSFLKNRRPKFAKNFLTSSSDSELSGSYPKKFMDDIHKEGLTYTDPRFDGIERPVHVAKKTRTVSFWKSPEYKLGHGPDVRTRKKMVPRSEESIVVDLKRNKPKHD